MVWKTLTLFQTAGKFIAVCLKNLDQHTIISYNLTHNWHAHFIYSFQIPHPDNSSTQQWFAVMQPQMWQQWKKYESSSCCFGRGLIGSSWAHSHQGPHQGGSSTQTQELCVWVCVMMVVRHAERWAEHWGAAPSAQLGNSEDPSCRTGMGQWSC